MVQTKRYHIEILRLTYMIEYACIVFPVVAIVADSSGTSTDIFVAIARCIAHPLHRHTPAARKGRSFAGACRIPPAPVSDGRCPAAKRALSLRAAYCTCDARCTVSVKCQSRGASAAFRAQLLFERTYFSSARQPVAPRAGGYSTRAAPKEAVMSATDPTPVTTR